jgi:hypothetical protein
VNPIIKAALALGVAVAGVAVARRYSDHVKAYFEALIDESDTRAEMPVPGTQEWQAMLSEMAKKEREKFQAKNSESALAKMRDSTPVDTVDDPFKHAFYNASQRVQDQITEVVCGVELEDFQDLPDAWLELREHLVIAEQDRQQFTEFLVTLPVEYIHDVASLIVGHDEAHAHGEEAAGQVELIVERWFPTVKGD